MYQIQEITNKILYGHVLEQLKKIPSNSIDCAITSPPYFGLRSYGTEAQIWGGNENCNHIWETENKKGISGGKKSEKVQIKNEENFQIVPDTQYSFCSKCNAWKGELGQEPHHNLFIKNLQMIFDETMRILKTSGSLWINIADSYVGNASMPGNRKQASNRGTNFIQSNKGNNLGLKKKSLIGIPDRLKISMIDAGYICRNEVVWHKPNQMPQSAKDRFTNDFEKFYWFTKNTKYYFEQQKEENDRNKRTVWSINTQPQRELHFATYPTKLIEVPILATCPENGIVLDMFFGSGTTGLVAKKNNRNWIGIELNRDYVEIAKNRLNL